jgi:hypothetical protein
MSYRITKPEWMSRGGLSGTDVFRKASKNGRWTY